MGIKGPEGIHLKTIHGYKNYLVSSDGRVFSLNRGWGTTKELSQIKTGGYRQVALSRNGLRKNHLVHRLVLEAFMGPCPEGCEARHLDGVRGNNNIGNLAWGTRQENAMDRDKHGNTARGVRAGNSKLSENDVMEIRDLHKSGLTQEKLGTNYGVNHRTIGRILSGKTWSWLK